MKNDSIVFDIDGTLWDATPISAQGWNNGLRELGIERKTTVEEIQSVTGHPFDECVSILFPELIKQYSNLGSILEKNEIEAIRENGGVFYDGVLENVPKLSEAYKIFIVSNCQEWYLNILLDRAGFKHLIEGHDCNGMSGLPKGQMLARLKEKYSLKAPVYIGDTASDQAATDIADMEFIHAAYGFGIPARPARSFDSFSALARYFLMLPQIDL